MVEDDETTGPDDGADMVLLPGLPATALGDAYLGINRKVIHGFILRRIVLFNFKQCLSSSGISSFRWLNHPSNRPTTRPDFTSSMFVASGVRYAWEQGSYSALLSSTNTAVSSHPE